MRSPFLILLLSGLATTANAVDAGWRQTEWGMSEQQVTDALNGKVYPSGKGQAEYWEILPSLFSLATFGGYQVRADYYFEDGRGLTSVRLKPTDTIWCLDMFRYLHKNYDYTGPGEHSYVWQDVRKGNLVQLSRLSDCTVTFSSVKEDSGLNTDQ